MLERVNHIQLIIKKLLQKQTKKSYFFHKTQREVPRRLLIAKPEI